MLEPELYNIDDVTYVVLISVAFILPVTVRSPSKVSVVFLKYVSCTESLPD